MKAVLLEQFAIEHLLIIVIPTSAIDDNEVLVKTTAVSLEYHFYRFKSGKAFGKVVVRF